VVSHSVMSEMQVIEQETPVGARYKDNPFTVGDTFGSLWDADGGTASFTTSWALEKDEPKEEVTISSIQPIGERYQHILTQSASLDWKFPNRDYFQRQMYRPWQHLSFLSSGRASGFDSVLPSGPDIAQFKQGVKTVAGKMAVLANGVMNTIQVRHPRATFGSSLTSLSMLIFNSLRLAHVSQDRYGSY
ncbi:hypothetical protein XENOCAPTIV_003757, partial [Xenoophorus captivus]